MPRYDFQCKDCGYVFEEKVDTQVISLSCPCCSADARRLVSLPYLNGETVAKGVRRATH